MTPLLFAASDAAGSQLAQFVVNCLITGSSYALVSLGFNLMYSTSKVYDFAYGGIYAVAAYIAYSLFIDIEINFIVATVTAVCVAVTIAYSLERVFYGPIRMQRATPLAAMLGSLGIYTIIENSITIMWGSSVRSARPDWVKSLEFPWGVRVTNAQLLIFCASIGLMIATTLLIRRTRFGLGLRAIASDPSLANLNGIAVSKYLLLSRVTGYGLSALAGSLMALDRDLIPTIGFKALLIAVVAAIIGGTGNFAGAVVGGLMLSFFENVAVWQFSGQWQNSAAFVALILVLLIRPYGLFGNHLSTR